MVKVQEDLSPLIFFICTRSVLPIVNKPDVPVFFSANDMKSLLLLCSAVGVF